MAASTRTVSTAAVAPVAPATSKAPKAPKAPVAPVAAPAARTVVRWTAPATATAQDVEKAEAQLAAARKRLADATARKSGASLIHRYTVRIPRYEARLAAVRLAAGTAAPAARKSRKSAQSASA